MILDTTIGSVYCVDSKENNNNVQALDNEGFQLTVNFDQQSYYQGEEFVVIIRLTENGMGFSGEICLDNITDPNGELIFYGMCFTTDVNGWENFSYPLNPAAPLGFYNVSVTAHLSEVINVYALFEVVSSWVTAEADGPYEAMIGDSIHFQGDGTGGKSPYTWSWTLGDGNISTEQNPIHTYTGTGVYNVHLTVHDNGSYSGDDATTAIIYGPDFGYYLIVFTDDATYHPGETVNISGRLTNNGNGVPSSPVTIHIEDPLGTMISVVVLTNQTGFCTYEYLLGHQALAGRYNITANASVTGDPTASTFFEVLSYTVIANAGGPYQAKTNRPIQFLGDATGGVLPYTWHWDFGDGNISTEQNPVYNYSHEGNYTVNLHVTDAYGNQGSNTTLASITLPSPDTHRVLVEYTTATTCVPCVTASEQLYQIYSANHLDFNYISFVTDKNQKAADRQAELKDTNAPPPYAVPDVFFEGNYTHVLGSQPSTSTYENAINTCYDRAVANLEMSVNVTYTEDALLNINITVVNNDIGIYNGTLRVYIVEPVSRWNNNAGNPYHFGLLDFIVRDLNIMNTATISLTWNSVTAGSGVITPGNIMVIASAFNNGTGFADETASGSPGELFTVKISKPANALYIRDQPRLTRLPYFYPIVIGDIIIEAEAFSVSSSILRVVFYVDNTIIGQDFTKPYNCTWDQRSFFKRWHTIKATAYDSNDHQVSEEIKVLRFF